MIGGGAETVTPVASATGEPRFIQQCSHCHSEKVVLDAWASWSYERQEWELGETFDHAYCEVCESDCEIETVPEAAVD